jgi:hypothetical protein
LQRYRGAGNRRKSTIADQHFGERPIGSVSVLDLDQAKEIDAILRSRCNAAEFLYRISCAETTGPFKGREQNIMFLSLVVDRSNALPGNLFD